MPSGPYSQAIGVTGPLLFISGQDPTDPATGRIAEGGFDAQVRQALRNLSAVASAANASLAAAASVRVFLADLANLDALNAVYREHFPESQPARTTIGCQLPGYEVEIDAVIPLELPAR
jgi:2-iminobutanoate/2-iminopropanoate deaminase